MLVNTLRQAIHGITFIDHVKFLLELCIYYLCTFADVECRHQTCIRIFSSGYTRIGDSQIRVISDGDFNILVFQNLENTLMLRQ